MVDSLPLDSRPVWKYQDIDSFISMTTLPPPPDADAPDCGRLSETTDEDFSNLIIPPPPSSATTTRSNNHTDVTVTLGRVEALKSPTENKISPKIALLQSQLKKNNINADLNNLPSPPTNNIQ